MALTFKPRPSVGGTPTSIARRRRPDNLLLRLVEDFSAPTISAPAGFFREVKRRNAGEVPRPFLQEIKRGFNERITYMDVVDSKLEGFALNVLLDPPTWIPIAAVAKLPGAAKAAQGLRQLSKASEAIPLVRRSKLALGSRFIPGFKGRKLLGNENAAQIHKLQMDRVEALQAARIVAEEEYEQVLATIVTDAKERARIPWLIENAGPVEGWTEPIIKNPVRSSKLQEELLRRAAKSVEEGIYLTPGEEEAFELLFQSRKAEMQAKLAGLENEIGELQFMISSIGDEELGDAARSSEILKFGFLQDDLDAVGKTHLKRMLGNRNSQISALKKRRKGLRAKLAKEILKPKRGKKKAAAPKGTVQDIQQRNVTTRLEAELGQKSFGGKFGKVPADAPKNNLNFKPRPDAARQVAPGEPEIFGQFGPPKGVSGETWMKEFTKLSPEGQKGFQAAAKMRRELEGIKIREGLLTEGAADGLRKKFNLQYLKHSFLNRKDELRMIQLERDAIKAGNIDAKAKATLKSLDDYENAFKNMHVASRPLTIERTNRLRIGEGLRKERNIGGTIDEISERFHNAIENDIAKIMGVEAAEVGRAIANKNYVEGIGGMLRKSGIGIKVGSRVSEDPIAALRHYEKILGDTRAAKDIVREGFEFIDAPGLRDLAIPRFIAEEIKLVTRTLDSPGEMQRFFANYAKLQNMWKAHTLAVFPAYHARNIVSDAWLNFLVGMDMRDLKVVDDYRVATRLVWKRLNGARMSDGWEKDTVKALRVKRVWESGSMSEIADEMKQGYKLASPLERIYRPDANPLVQAGYQSGQFFQDVQRTAHFLWRRRKGDDVDQAAASVHKWLYDWQYGLTQFEQKAFRDFLFPYYGWFRFNLPLQVEALVTRTGKQLLIPKAVNYIQNEWGGPEPGEIGQAEWMKKMFMLRVKYDPETGQYQQLMLSGWIPFADLMALTSRQNFVDAVTGLLTPGIKLPAELITNYDLFRKGPIQRIPGQKRRFLGVDLDARITHIGRSWRFLNEVNNLFFNSKDISTLAIWRRGITGLKTYPIEIKRQKKYWARLHNLEISTLKRTLSYEKKKKAGLRNPREIKRIEGMIQEAEAQKRLNR